MVTGPVSRPSLPAEGSPGANSSPESSPDPTATAGQPGAGLWMRPFSRPGGDSCPQQEVQGHEPSNVPSRTGDHGLAAPVGTASGGDPRSADRRQAPPRRVQEGRRDVVVVRDRQRLRLRVVDGAHRKAVARARKALDTKDLSRRSPGGRRSRHAGGASSGTTGAGGRAHVLLGPESVGGAAENRHATK
jgi:hypothetical protein